MCLSVLLHVTVFLALDKVKFALGIETPPVPQRVVVTRDTDAEPLPPSFPENRQTPDDVAPPPPSQDKLFEKIDLLKATIDKPVDITPQIKKEVFDFKVGAPAAAAGLPNANPAIEESPVQMLDNRLEQLGRDDSDFKPAAPGQVVTIVDPGSMKMDDSDLSKLTSDLIRKGAGGKAANGSLEGLRSLDEMLGLPANELLGARTMLSSDLLFDFNKYVLRDGAKFGLQKVGMLMDTNPKMYCWIEGHTDLIGGDAANIELSRKRAESVKEYLVGAMRMDPDKIITRGYGRFHPIVTSGDAAQQSPNRRVEIKMRSTPPPDEQMKIAPPKASAVEEMPPAPPVAAPVKTVPKPRVPVEVVPTPAPRPPRAKAVAEPAAEPTLPPAMRALPVHPEPTAPPIRRAIPVVPEAPTAVPIAEPVEE